MALPLPMYVPRTNKQKKTHVIYQCAWFGVVGMFFAYLLFLVLQIGLQDVRYSMMYIPKDGEEIAQEHNQRVGDVSMFFKELDASIQNGTFRENSERFTKTRVDVCVAIASVDRNPHQYLTITLGSVLQGLSQEERERYGVKIFVIDTEPSPERNLEAKDFGRKYPRELFEVVSTDISPLRYKGWADKEVLDYVFALRVCEKVKPKFAIILEDDVMATNHFVSKFFAHAESITDDNHYMDIKIFYPDFYCGFSGVFDHTVIVILALLASALVTSFLWNKMIASQFQTRFMFVLLFLYFTALFVLLPLIIGKQNICPCTKRGIHKFYGTAFTNAVAYPHSQLDNLAKILEEKYQETNVDLLLDHIAVDNKYDRYAIVPNLFQHIGLYSSNRAKNQGNDSMLKTSLNFESDYEN